MFSEVLLWCHRQESDLHLGIRNPSFYPLNYSGE